MSISTITVKIEDRKFEVHPLDDPEEGTDGRYMIVVSEEIIPVVLIREGEAWFVEIDEVFEIPFRPSSRTAV